MKKLVFIIDDDPVYLQFMKGHFKQMDNYETQIFQSGQDALKSMVTIKPDVVILDHSFLNDPIKTGLDYLQEIRKLNSSIPVIYITATDNAELRAKTQKLKVKSYILKNDGFLIHLRSALDKISTQSKSSGILKKFFKK
jgi:DNA-binding NarL/FixJ family response regulator